MKKKFQSLFLLLSLGFSIYSCTDSSDSSAKPGTAISPNDEELITTVQLELRDSTNTVLDTIEFSDNDGPGGNDPIIDSLVLDANSVYLVNVFFLDASDPNDVKDITAEVQAEGDEHFVCFEFVGGNGFNVQVTDSDGSLPIGLESRWITNNATNSKLKLTLKHQVGVKDGTCSPGETDIEVTFPLKVN